MKVHMSVRHGLVTLLLVMTCMSCIMDRVWATMQHFEVQRHLKRLNKPAVKSIKSPDGDIIDCVHISHQPAFDHPLLKNHTIQMRPSFHPLSLYDENNVASKVETSSIPQLWHQNGRCPEGTIPIRRIKKDSVLRASSIERYGKKRLPTSGDPDWSNGTYEHAVAYVNRDKYNGAKATINVWNPRIQQQYEYSLAQLSIFGGPEDRLNTIEAGWHVYPHLYGDSNTRLFTYWTFDDYQSTGCYNHLCSGFIQTNNDIALGATIYPMSSYGGSQYEITIFVWRDSETGDWWLQYGDQAPLGYWQAHMLNFLLDGASEVQWGGQVLNLNSINGEHTSTEMGSGHFPEEGFGKASYFKNIQIVDQSNNLQAPQGIATFVTQCYCYDMQNDDNGYFYYGGPGLNPGCP